MSPPPAALLCSHPSRQALLPPLLPGSPPLCCLQGSPTRLPCCLCALAARGVFHLHLPHHSCLPRSPPTPCSPPAKELLETLSPIKVGAPDRTPIPSPTGLRLPDRTSLPHSFLFSFLNLFWLRWVFITALGGFSSCSTRASPGSVRCAGFSPYPARALGHMG